MQTSGPHWSAAEQALLKSSKTTLVWNVKWLKVLNEDLFDIGSK